MRVLSFWTSGFLYCPESRFYVLHGILYIFMFSRYRSVCVCVCSIIRSFEYFTLLASI